jgi:heme-degrading monooxygenase HmoA
MASVQPTIMLLVRGLKSNLSREEFERRYRERMPSFREVSGLVQKYYAYDEASEAWAGVYLWNSEESLTAYLESDLRKTIASVYELTEPPVIERFPIVDVLRSTDGGAG